MPFADYEESRALGQPVELYYFRYGETVNAYIAYTNAEQVVVFNGVEFQPEIVNRSSSIRSSGSLDKQTINISVGIRTELAELFKIYPPTAPVTLSIFGGHLGDPTNEFLTIWSGRVLTGKREGSEFNMQCEPINTSMKRTGLRRHYQLLCPHLLYSQGEGLCNASKAAAKVTVNIVNKTADNRTFTLPDFWNPHPAESYLNGIVEWNSDSGREYRTILSVVDGKTITMGGPMVDVQPGDPVDIFLGCNHHPGLNDNLGDCKNRHNNIQNYGGMLFIPTENPVGKNPFG